MFFIALLPIFANIGFDTVSAQSISIVSDDYIDNIYLYYVKGPKVDDRIKIKLKDGLSIADQPNFNRKLTTVFYFHGFGGSAKRISVRTLVTALLERKTCNIVVLDYSVLLRAKPLYIFPINFVNAIVNVTHIGAAIGGFLREFIPRKQPENLVHLMSHSLGSQIMSCAAKTYGPGRLWLTALDPTGSLFNIPLLTQLSASDGSFVDVIYTNGGEYGDGRKGGHVNIYPNGGISQPGCLFNFVTACSHKRSWKYYAEAITNQTAFPAKNCKAGPEHNCNDTDIIYVGLDVNKKASGEYYLNTRSSAPFGDGKEGINFKRFHVEL